MSEITCNSSTRAEPICGAPAVARIGEWTMCQRHLKIARSIAGRLQWEPITTGVLRELVVRASRVPAEQETRETDG